MVLIPLLLALYAWGGAHSQQWECSGSITTYGARCGVAQQQPLPIPAERW
jgi:hypothetical protein